MLQFICTACRRYTTEIEIASRGFCSCGGGKFQEVNPDWKWLFWHFKLWRWWRDNEEFESRKADEKLADE